MKKSIPAITARPATGAGTAVEKPPRVPQSALSTGRSLIILIAGAHETTRSLERLLDAFALLIGNPLVVFELLILSDWFKEPGREICAKQAGRLVPRLQETGAGG